MTKEISKEVIAKVLGLYLGAEVETPDGTGIMHTVCQSGHIYAKCEGMQTEEYTLYECQLILSDLSAISEADKIEVAKIAGFNTPDTPEGMAYIGLGIILFHLCNTTPYDDSRFNTVWTRKFITEVKPSTVLFIIDFLRSRSYMLPAFGIPDLFEAGIAVRKNKEV